MTKRQANFGEGPSKKTRLDDLWDDDFDIDADAVEDCFRQATQEVIASTQQHNSTLLASSFRAFMPPRFSSTQTNGSGGAGLEIQIQQLQERYEEREGEVSILRSNLRELRTGQQSELDKRKLEWKLKEAGMLKDLKTVQSQLEFKNLEIANLKQKNAEISKRMIQQRASVSPKKADSPQKRPSQKTPPPKDACYKFHTPVQPYYPLRDYDASAIFRLPPEDRYIPRTRYNSYKNTIPYLQSQVAQTEADFLTNLKPALIVVGGKPLRVNYIYPEMTGLIGTSAEEMDSDSSVAAINKIICVSLQFLSDFHMYLTRIETHTQLQEIQQADTHYLQANNQGTMSHSDKNSLGAKTGELLSFLGEVLPFSRHLRRYLLEGGQLALDPALEYVKVLPALRTEEELRYLRLVLATVTVIGRLRKSHECSRVLSAVIKMLEAAFGCCETTPECTACLCNIVKEVLFSRPDHPAVLKLPSMLKAASGSEKFVRFLCGMPHRPTVKISLTKGLVYFSKDSCLFHMFAVMFENTLRKMGDNGVSLEISHDVLCFACRIFGASPAWTHYREGNKCDCLKLLYKMVVNVAHNATERYKVCQKNTKRQEYTSFFRTVGTAFSLLAFNSYELTEKGGTVYAQYREVVKNMIEFEDLELDKDDLSEIEKLNLSDEMPKIPVEKLTGIDF